MKTPSSFDDPEIRSHVKGALLSLLVLIVALATCGIWFEEEIKNLGRLIYEMMGIPGLSLLVFLGDSVITPVPPDVALIVIQQSELAHDALWLVTWLGCVSTCAGFVGWFLGNKLHSTSLPRRIFGPKLEGAERLMRKFGSVAVAIGALTPLPYSLTTWTAGIFDMPVKKMIIPTLLRIPRFWLYYWILQGAFKFGEGVKALF